MKSGEAKNDDQKDAKGKGLTASDETQPNNIKTGSRNKRNGNCKDNGKGVVAGNDGQDGDKNQVDKRATSPSHNLQGASRTVRGFSWGHALENTYSHADASDLQMDLDLTIAVHGKVYIYESLVDAA